MICHLHLSIKSVHSIARIPFESNKTDKLGGWSRVGEGPLPGNVRAG